MSPTIADASNQNLNQIDTNKDRQESAVLAFTIVTVIFLPLSTVASIFGMNTSDVRNMDQDQWVYWAAALPLLLLVGGLCLAYTGGFSSLVRGTMGLFSPRWSGLQSGGRPAVVAPPAYVPSGGKFGNWDGNPYEPHSDGFSHITGRQYYRGPSLVPPSLRQRPTMPMYD